jgi:hypothetical protein
VTADTVIAEIVRWLRLVALLLLLITLAVILARSFGIMIPLKTLGHIELAYLAGAYYLTK